MVFMTLTLSQMGNALAIRSDRDSLFRIGLLSNKPMLGAVLLTFALQLAVTYVPFLQDIFGTQALTAGELAISLAASTVVFIVSEIWKALLRIPETRELVAVRPLAFVPSSHKMALTRRVPMIPNQWYAVLESHEVKRGKPVGVTRMGEKMVFWRDQAGRWSLRATCARTGASH